MACIFTASSSILSIHIYWLLRIANITQFSLVHQKEQPQFYLPSSPASASPSLFGSNAYLIYPNDGSMLRVDSCSPNSGFVFLYIWQAVHRQIEATLDVWLKVFFGD